MQKQAKTQMAALRVLLQGRGNSPNNMLSIGSWYSNYRVLDFPQAAGGKNAHCRKPSPFPKSCSGVASGTPKLCFSQSLTSDKNGGRIISRLLRAHILNYFQTFLQPALMVYAAPPCSKLKRRLYLIFSDFHCNNVIYGLSTHLMCTVTSLQDVLTEAQLSSYSVSPQVS